MQNYIACSEQVWLAPVKQNSDMIVYYCYFLCFKALALCLALTETQEIMDSLLTVSELTAQTEIGVEEGDLFSSSHNTAAVFAAEHWSSIPMS